MLGTNHEIQRGNFIQKEEFRLYLEQLVNDHEIKAIGEEINDDNPTISLAKEVATNNAIAYKIIEPNPNEYDELKIEHVHNIDYQFRCRYDLEESPSNISLRKLAYEEYDSRIQNTYRTREAEWLKRLQKLDKWPVLVICGADHFQPFCKLLIENGINVKKDNPYWGSNI